MAFQYTNSKGKTYWLHCREGKGGSKLFFFSKSSDDSVDLDEEKYEVFENERTGLPMLRRKK